MYYGLTVRCAGLDGRVNFLISVVAYLADVRRAISVICHNKKLLSFCRQSGAAVSQTRLAVPTFFISKTNIRLMPSHFVPYANVVPPLTPHLAESVPLLCEQPCACRKAAISRGVFNHSPSRLLSFGIRLARLRAYPVIEFSQSVMSLRKGLIRIVFGLCQRCAAAYAAPRRKRSASLRTAMRVPQSGNFARRIQSLPIETSLFRNPSRPLAGISRH